MPKTPLPIVKLSTLDKKSVVGEETLFLSATDLDTEPKTVTSSLTTLRQALGFEFAYSTVAAGLADTSTGESFFVYESTAKDFVLGFININGAAQPVIGYDSNQIRQPTQRRLNEVSKTLDTGGASLIRTRNGSSVQDELDTFIQVNDTVSLREQISPNGSLATVTAYHPSWQSDNLGAIGGGVFRYDADDSTSTDDGVFNFVTTGGGCWKRVLKNQVYNLEMGGVRPGDDATVVLNILIGKLISGYATLSTPGTVPINFGNGSIEVNPGTYLLSGTVQLYTVTPLIALGDVTFDGRLVTSGAGIFKISNDGLPKAKKPKYLTTGIVLNGQGGTINIVGDKKVPGIAIGNTMANQADCRDHLINNVSVSYVTSFIDFNGAYDTYLTVVSNFRGYGCSLNGIIFSQTTFSNSGERMQFIEMTLGGCDGNAFSVAQPGVMISIHNASFDFISGNIINLSPNVSYAMIDITGGSHAEAFNGYVGTSNSGTNKITWNGGTILPTSRSRGTLDNYAGRILFNGLLQTFQLRDVHILSSYPSDNASVYLGTPFTDSPVILSSTGLFTTYGHVPSKYDIVNMSPDFSSEVVGTVMGGSVVTLNKFMKPEDLTFWRQGVTPTVVQLADGTNALQLVPTTTGLTTNFIVLTTVDYIPVVGAKTLMRLWAVCQTLTSTLRLRVEVSFAWYDANKVLISKTQSGGTSDLYTNSQITTLPSYSSDPTTNGNRKLASLANSQFSVPGAVFGKPIWTISGIDQTININQLCTAYVQ